MVIPLLLRIVMGTKLESYKNKTNNDSIARVKPNLLNLDQTDKVIILTECKFISFILSLGMFSLPGIFRLSRRTLLLMTPSI